MVKKLEGAGLRGQVAGETSLCTVGQEEGLAYRGHKNETLLKKVALKKLLIYYFMGSYPINQNLIHTKSF